MENAGAMILVGLTTANAAHYGKCRTQPLGDQELIAMAQENQELRQEIKELRKRADIWELVMQKKITDDTA
jgi:uncharacterized membrane protein